MLTKTKPEVKRKKINQTSIVMDTWRQDQDSNENWENFTIKSLIICFQTKM
jgi:hypothetical protein